MSKTKTSATATVTMTVIVELSQPWGGESSIDQVRRTAEEEAQSRINARREDLARSGILIGKVSAVRISLLEEKQ